MVCFMLGGQEYAVPIGHVKETLALRPLTRVFLTPPWVAGICNVRGEIAAVLDLALMLGMAPSEPGPDSRIVILQAGAHAAGALVDRMAELRDCDLAALQSPPPTLIADATELMLGLITVEERQPLRVLDVPSLLSSDRLRASSE